MTHKRKRSPHIRGICADAERLGVSRVHLHLVLKGKRKSRSLLERYNKLQKQKAN
jgi:hypothetical protein